MKFNALNQFTAAAPNIYDTDTNGIRLAALPNAEVGNNPLFNYNNLYQRSPNQESAVGRGVPLA